MIETTIFKNLIFPNLIISPDGYVVGTGTGTIFKPETRCQSPEYLNTVQFAPSGWSTCKYGYACYRFKIPSIQGCEVIIFALKVNGVSTIQGKTDTLSIKLDKEIIEQYTSSVIKQINEVNDYMKSFLLSNLHEIRSINSNIYNTTLGLRQDLENREFREETDLPVLKNIESLSEIQKVRSDYMDIVSGQSQADFNYRKIPVYKKFDRLCKSLTPVAKQKGLTLSITGESHSFVNGIALFDVIPYLLLHNAIKYSPPHQRIDVSIEENDFEIVVLVHSLGPKIDKEEESQIFQKGFRGKHARSISAEGNGIGLFFLQKLVNLHQNSNVKFHQEEYLHMSHKNTPYYRTSFCLRLQISEKQQNSKTTLLNYASNK